MTLHLTALKTKILPEALAALKKDIVLTVSLLLAIGSCLLVRPSVGYINFKVLVCLFDLMIVVKAFEELKLLDKFAVGILNKCTDSRMVSLILILLSFFMSMLVTNDVTLITLVPLALIISRKSNISMLTTVILQTLAANIGSSLTPMGNPQNLYIYSYYRLNALEFFAPVSLLAVIGLDTDKPGNKQRAVLNTALQVHHLLEGTAFRSQHRRDGDPHSFSCERYIVQVVHKGKSWPQQEVHPPVQQL